MKSVGSKFGIFFGLVGAVALLTFSGCARVGQDFNSSQVKEIIIGQTTKSDVVHMFGKPWRMGMENGVEMWTYGRYTYRIVGETDTKDLIIKFENDGRVKSYTFNKTVD